MTHKGTQTITTERLRLRLFTVEDAQEMYDGLAGVMDLAADKGIAPPPIRGYRQEDGHNTNKILRVLNAFYKYKTENESKEPMPIEVFKERKKVINELSKDTMQSIEQSGA